MPTTSLADRLRIAVERFSLRNLVYALLGATLLAGVSAAVTLRAAEAHESVAVLLIDNPLALATSGNESTVNKLEQLRGKYATLAHTDVIAGPVAQRLGLRVDEVIADTVVSPTPATLSLFVSARAAEPEQARALAAALSDEIGAFVAAEHEQHGVPAADRFTIRVVQPASSPVQVSPSSDRAVSSALVSLLVALGVAYLALQLLRPPLAAGERLDPG